MPGGHLVRGQPPFDERSVVPRIPCAKVRLRKVLDSQGASPHMCLPTVPECIGIQTIRAGRPGPPPIPSHKCPTRQHEAYVRLPTSASAAGIAPVKTV